MATLEQHFGQQLLNGQLTVERAACSSHEIRPTENGMQQIRTVIDGWKEIVPGGEIILHCRIPGRRQAAPATDQARPVGANPLKLTYPANVSARLSQLIAERNQATELHDQFVVQAEELKDQISARADAVARIQRKINAILGV